MPIFIRNAEEVRSGARQQAGSPEFSASTRQIREIPRTVGGRGEASGPPPAGGRVGGSRFHGRDEGFDGLDGVWAIVREEKFLPFSSVWMMIQRLKSYISYVQSGGSRAIPVENLPAGADTARHGFRGFEARDRGVDNKNASSRME